MRTLYLNNTGTRWTTRPTEAITLETKAGKTITRRVNFWQQFGNFATANISYKGKRINVFSDSKLED